MKVYAVKCRETEDYQETTWIVGVYKDKDSAFKVANAEVTEIIKEVPGSYSDWNGNWCSIYLEDVDGDGMLFAEVEICEFTLQ